QRDAPDEVRALPGGARPSQVISVLGRHYVTGRAAILLAVLVVVGCETMIADRFLITTPPDHLESIPPTAVVVKTAQTALVACRVQENHLSSDSDSLSWRDPDHPPGLHITVKRDGNDIRVSLAQDLFGPIGPTDVYRCVKPMLRRQLEQQFGTSR